MKRIKAVNGYTIYQATARDAANRNVEEGYFYLFFSSDIRDYGLANSEWDWEAGSIEEAEAFATSTNYAAAKEIAEENTTAASYEEIAEVEAKLDRISQRNQEAEELLAILDSSLEKIDALPFDPGFLYDLVIYDDEGETVARFPMEHTNYTVHEDLLLVESYGALHTYHLERYSYYTEGR